MDRRQFVAGLLFGLACTARLTVVFGAPFFVLVGSGGDWRRRSLVGRARCRHPDRRARRLRPGHDRAASSSPAYDYLYRLETAGYPALGYHTDWAVEDLRYLPQNLGIALFGPPDVFPTTLPDALGLHPVAVCTGAGAVRGLFDVACPLAVPRDTGMSVILTSPAYLLAIPALRSFGRSRLVTGAALAVALIALVNLMHFSQGWVQFGYRFSNDAAPFALLLVAARVRASGRSARLGACLSA